MLFESIDQWCRELLIHSLSLSNKDQSEKKSRYVYKVRVASQFKGGCGLDGACNHVKAFVDQPLTYFEHAGENMSMEGHLLEIFVHPTFHSMGLKSKVHISVVPIVHVILV